MSVLLYELFGLFTPKHEVILLFEFKDKTIVNKIKKELKDSITCAKDKYIVVHLTEFPGKESKIYQITEHYISMFKSIVSKLGKVNIFILNANKGYAIAFSMDDRYNVEEIDHNKMYDKLEKVIKSCNYETAPKIKIRGI